MAVEIFIDAGLLSPTEIGRVIDSVQAHGWPNQHLTVLVPPEQGETELFVRTRRLAVRPRPDSVDWADLLALAGSRSTQASSGVCVLAAGVRLTPLTGFVLHNLSRIAPRPTLFSVPAGPVRNPLAPLAAILDEQAGTWDESEMNQALASRMIPGMALGCLFAPLPVLRLLAGLGSAEALRALTPTGLRLALASAEAWMAILPHLVAAPAFLPICIPQDSDDLRRIDEPALVATSLFRCWPMAGPTAEGPHLYRLLHKRRHKPRLLHLVHGWGGGSRAWIDLFASSDDRHDHFVLESSTGGCRSSDRLILIRHVGERTQRTIYQLRMPLYEIALDHPEYAATMRDIIATHKIDGLMISSLIGHSLECMETGLPTTVILHDFFPYCVGLNLTFDGGCGNRCNQARLEHCLKDNPFSGNFRRMGTATWLAVRERWAKAGLADNVRLVAPSGYVRDAVEAALPVLQGQIDVIEHASGLEKHDLWGEWTGPRDGQRFKVLVLGHLSHHKGLEVFQGLVDRMGAEVDFHLLGCLDMPAARFADYANVTAVPQYTHAQLPDLVRGIRPHLALCLSIVPETFSFTLSELRQMSLPVVATQLGAIGQRVAHAGGGVVVPPTVQDFVEAIKSLMANPDRLRVLAQEAHTIRNLTCGEMHEAYRRLMPIEPRDGHCLEVRRMVGRQASERLYLDVARWVQNKRANYQAR